MSHTVSIDLNGQPFSMETGKVARQADGAVVVRYGGTMILATCVAARSAREAQDFFPLTVDYRERAYAGGRIPGGYFKREGAPVKKEILTSRLIDRPIRPLFPEGFRNEVQVICLAISGDQENDPDVLAMNGASAAVCLSGVPFEGPVGAVRVGLIDGAFVVNPTNTQQAASTLELVIAGTEDAVLMVESGSREIAEETMLEAIAFGHAECRKLARAQKELVTRAGKPRRPFDPSAGRDEALVARVRALVGDRLQAALETHDKHARAEAVGSLLQEAISALGLEESQAGAVRAIFESLEKAEVRRLIVERGLRVDGRKVNEIRPIAIEMAYLPRAHGSALFTRGETQAMVAATLGTKSDEQKIEALEGETYRHFMLHYNFPPFSVGEVRRFGSPSRRDIGHGALAERAVEAVLPSKEEFPYTIRIVSDILESNGSSSMATVCGACLALLDAGVPLKSHVAGIAMGLVKEGDRFGILTDIMGTEDHYGDMDFKVAGTEKGITALQMDIKIAGVSIDIMRTALQNAREARLTVLAKMREAMEKPRAELSPFAPRFVTIKIRPEKIREIIGPGGKVIRGIQEQTGTKIDVEDDGKVTVFSPDAPSVQKAVGIIQDICREVELDRIYLGKVKKIVEFGAFVEVIPTTEGLLHISQIAESRIRAVSDVLAEGDEVLVKVIEIDGNGKMRLSRKMALREQPALADREKLKLREPRRPVTEAHRKGVLPNGIRVLTERMPHVRSVSVGIWVGTGSRREPDDRGISHLIEHLVFKGTATRSAQEIARAMDSVGGQMDAFTTKEHTCFYVQVLDEHLPFAVDLLTDILLHPLFNAEELEREKSVVLQEIKMVEDTPDDIIHDIFAEQIWSDHPLGRPILGTRERVSGFGREGVLDYFREEYVPPAIIVAVAGNVEHEPVLDLFARAFEGFQRVPVERPDTSPRMSAKIHIVGKTLEQVHVVMGFPGLPHAAPERHALFVLNDIIGGSMSSRLFQEVRERQGLVYSIHSGAQSYRDTGLLYLYAATDPANFSKMLKAILKELRELKKHGITEDELTRAKDHLKGGLMLGLESTSSRMNRLAKHEMHFGTFFTMDAMLGAIAGVRLEEVQALLGQLLDEEHLALTTLGPLDRRNLPRELLHR